MAKAFTLEKLRQLLQAEARKGRFNRVLAEKLDIKSAENGSVLAEMVVDKSHLNIAGTLHGGCSSTLVDTVSTFALLTKQDVRSSSVELSLSFLAPAKEGDLITIQANTLRLGRTLAYLTVDIKKDDKLLVYGKHTKFVRHGVSYLPDDLKDIIQ